MYLFLIFEKEPPVSIFPKHHPKALLHPGNPGASIVLCVRHLVFNPDDAWADSDADADVDLETLACWSMMMISFSTRVS